MLAYPDVKQIGGGVPDSRSKPDRSATDGAMLVLSVSRIDLQVPSLEPIFLYGMQQISTRLLR